MLAPYIITIGVFLALLLLIRYSFNSRSKNGDDTGRYDLFSPGDSGEYAVARQLRRLPDEYLIINDLLFHNGAGHTTQIDHVVVSPYGIFVIETKNISGNIYGSVHAQKWKRYLRTWWYGIQRDHELEFQNPLLQNQAHIESLKRVLGQFEPVDMISIIAFSPNAILNVHADTANLLYWSELRRFIRRYNTQVMPAEEAYAIYAHLRALNIKEKDARDNHAIQAHQNKSMHEQRMKEALAQGLCPKCGGKLILRDGRHGPFYGCCNYPECKYTHPA